MAVRAVTLHAAVCSCRTLRNRIGAHMTVQRRAAYVAAARLAFENSQTKNCLKLPGCWAVVGGGREMILQLANTALGSHSQEVSGKPFTASRGRAQWRRQRGEPAVAARECCPGQWSLPEGARSYKKGRLAWLSVQPCLALPRLASSAPEAPGRFVGREHCSLGN